MSFTISASANTLSARARLASVARVSRSSNVCAQPMRRGNSLVVRASVWSNMSTYMKKQCEEAAALEAKDVDAGRQAWIDIDKQVPGARMAYLENATAGGSGLNVDQMAKLCDDDPNAEECKVFDE